MLGNKRNFFILKIIQFNNSSKLYALKLFKWRNKLSQNVHKLFVFEQ